MPCFVLVDLEEPKTPSVGAESQETISINAAKPLIKTRSAQKSQESIELLSR